MPSPEFERELRGMGLHSEGIVSCPKCHRPVEKWGKYLFNPADHPTDPLVIHLASCGQREEEAPGLPPVPVQRVTLSEVANYPEASDVEDLLKGLSDPDPITGATFDVMSVEPRSEGWYKREYERLMREKEQG